MKTGKIIIICGPSGVGKDTIIQKLFKDKNLNLKTIPTITTRPFSSRDLQIGNYKFISKDEFFKKSKAGKFLETNYYDQNYYGTLKENMQKILDSGQNGIKEQDLITAIKTKKQYPKNIIVIFIDSTLETIRQRLVKRGENTPEQIQRRLEIGQKELSQKHLADFIVDNPQNYPEIAVKEIKKIILSK